MILSWCWLFGKPSKEGSFGHFNSHEADSIMEKYNLEEIELKGNAGDLILFDARGIHRRKCYISGERMILHSFFG